MDGSGFLVTFQFALCRICGSMHLQTSRSIGRNGVRPYETDDFDSPYRTKTCHRSFNSCKTSS